MKFSPIEDLTGRQIHFFTVLRRIPKTNSREFECKCVCGKEVKAYYSKLISGSYKSCGCKTTELITKHNMVNTRVYQCWSDMKTRCNCKTNRQYYMYGGRGIKVCERWDKFENFWEDMKEGYSDNLTLDRIEVDGNYEKSNCRWATSEVQGINRRATRWIEIDGEKKTIKDWSKVYGNSVGAIHHRLSVGWEPIKAVKEPYCRGNKSVRKRCIS